MLRLVASFIVVLFVAYAALILLLWSQQQRFIYPAPPVSKEVPRGFEVVAYRTAGGLDLKAGYRPAQSGQPTLLFFHGNGADWQSTAFVTQRLAARGFGVLAAEYRGYGGNPGTPSEHGLYADGRAAYAFLRQNGVAAGDIVLVGNSIGSGVATQLATEVKAGALVLISPFDSLEETAARSLWWLPVRLLLRDRFDNAGKFSRITMPILILHGEADTLIRVEQARKLAATRPDANLVIYPGWGHDLVVNAAVQEEIATFSQQFE